MEGGFVSERGIRVDLKTFQKTEYDGQFRFDSAEHPEMWFQFTVLSPTRMLVEGRGVRTQQVSYQRDAGACVFQIAYNVDRTRTEQVTLYV